MEAGRGPLTGQYTTHINGMRRNNCTRKRLVLYTLSVAYLNHFHGNHQASYGPLLVSPYTSWLQPITRSLESTYRKFYWIVRHIKYLISTMSDTPHRVIYDTHRVRGLTIDDVLLSIANLD